MGLLDVLYSLSAKAQTAGAKAYEKAGYYDLMDRLQQRQMQAEFARLQQQQSAPAVGLAQQLAASGMGPQGTEEVLGPDGQPTGRYRTVMDPAAATAVGLMTRSAGSRPLGVEMASGILGGETDPRLKLQRLGLELEAMREQRLSQGDPYAEERLKILRAAEDRKRLMSGRLPVGQVDEIIREESIDAGLESTALTMKPEFFGFGFDTVGDAAQEFKRRTGTDTPFIGFWNSLNTSQAERRYELFGATLTDNELAEWKRLSIQPSDAYEAAVAKLQAQQRAVARKREARARILKQQGYNVPEGAPPPRERPPLGSYWTQ